MRKFRRLGLPLIAAVVLLMAMVAPAGAANPIVQITVTASVVAITNDQAVWNIGTITAGAVVYFSATGAQDDSYATITNTGSVMVDVAIQGTDFDGTGALDWDLDTVAGVEVYSLYATNQSPVIYNIEVKEAAAYNDICSGLNATGADTCTWSMNFTAPSAFDVAEDGLSKNATVILVASV